MISRVARLQRAGTSLFLAFHCFAVFVWLWPGAAAWRTIALRWTAPYMNWLGLWQSWNMFAPSPGETNTDLEAVLTYADGSVRTVRFTEPRTLGPVRRYFSERERKWEENLSNGPGAAIWRDAAVFVARRNCDWRSPVVRVSIIAHWADIPPYPRGLGRRLPRHNRHATVYETTLFPGDLW